VSGAGPRALLRRGPFLRLLIGQGVSALGSWVGTVALIAAAWDLTGSPTIVGSVLVLRLVPPLVAAPVGGVLADRLDRRLIMVAANLGMAALIALVPFVELAGLLVIAFLTESLSMLFLPARDATVPDLAEDALPTANGFILASSYGVIPVAAALFSGLRLAADRVPTWLLGELFAARPLALPFFFNAAMFVVAAALFAALPASRDRRPDGPLRVFHGLGEAVRDARERPLIRGLAAGVGTAMFGGGVLFALGIAYVRDTLGAGDAEFGYLVSVWGLGMALGIGTVHLLVRRGEAAVFQAGVAACGGVLVAMAFLPYVWLALVAALVFGMAFAVAVMLAVTLVQRTTPEELRGRLLGGAHMLFRVSLAAGALGVGGAASALGPVSWTVAGLGVDLDGNQLGLLIGGAIILLGSAAARGAARNE
jgi:dTMP kinase